MPLAASESAGELRSRSDVPDDDGLCLGGVELPDGGDDGSIGAPAVDAVGLEGAGGDGEARERDGERAGEVEAGGGERRVALGAEDAGDVRGRVGRRAALDVV